MQEELTILDVEEKINKLYDKISSLIRDNIKLRRIVNNMKIDEMIIKLESIREENNKVWMDYLRLALKYNEESTINLLNQIVDNNERVVKSLADREVKIIEETNKINNTLLIGIVNLAERKTPEESAKIKKKIINYNKKVINLISQYIKERKELNENLEDKLNDNL